MVDFTLEVQRREALGKSANRRFRNEGLVPAVVYHRGEDSIPAVLPLRNFVHLAKQAKTTQVFRLKSEDKHLDGRPVLVREVRRDFLKGKVLHVDFQALREDEEIHVRVPLQVSGESPGVKNEGGILSIVTHEIGVACFPKDIPQNITIDISALALGQSIHARDVALPAGVRLTDDSEETLVSVVSVRATKADEAADAAAAAAAEGADSTKGGAGKAPAKGGAAPAKGGKK